MKKYFCELFGTFLLVLFGCGILSLLGQKCNPFIAGLAFGLVYLFGYYVFHKVCPCYLNPILPLVDFLDKKIKGKEFAGYVVFEFLGAILGALQLLIIVLLTTKTDALTTYMLAVNGYGELSKTFISVWLALIIEVLLSFFFAFVFIYFSRKNKFISYQGFILAAAYIIVVIAGYNFTGGSANPARSYGPSVVICLVGFIQSQEQIWLFIVAPTFGSFLAFITYKLVVERTNFKKIFISNGSKSISDNEKKRDSKSNSENSKKIDKSQNSKADTSNVQPNEKLNKDNNQKSTQDKEIKVEKKLETKPTDKNQLKIHRKKIASQNKSKDDTKIDSL